MGVIDDSNLSGWKAIHGYIREDAGFICKACALFAPSEVKQQKLGLLVTKSFFMDKAAFNSHEHALLPQFYKEQVSRNTN